LYEITLLNHKLLPTRVIKGLNGLLTQIVSGTVPLSVPIAFKLVVCLFIINNSFCVYEAVVFHCVWGFGCDCGGVGVCGTALAVELEAASRMILLSSHYLLVLLLIHLLTSICGHCR